MVNLPGTVLLLPKGSGLSLLSMGKRKQYNSWLRERIQFRRIEMNHAVKENTPRKKPRSFAGGNRKIRQFNGAAVVDVANVSPNGFSAASKSVAAK